MEMTEAEMMERLNPVLDPAFLREVARGIERTAASMRDPENYRRFFESPSRALREQGTPGLERLPPQAMEALDHTVRETRDQIPPPPFSPPAFEQWIKCVLCVIALTVVLILALVAIGVLVVAGLWLTSQLVPVIGAAVSAVVAVILGLSIPQLLNAIIGMISSGVLLGAFCIAIAVFVCPCRKMPAEA